jgi:hypothetical protein
MCSFKKLPSVLFNWSSRMIHVVKSFVSRGFLALLFCNFTCLTLVQATAPPGLDHVRSSLGKATLPWVPNAGQWDANAAFRAQSFAGSVWMTHDGKLVHQFNGPKAKVPSDNDAAADSIARLGKSRSKAAEHKPGWVLTERFVGGTVKQVKGADPQAANANYFLADRPAAANLPSYGQLALGEVYPGVTVALKATQANVEKLYTVAPGRNPAVIRMQIDGANALSILADGSLQAATDNGPVAFTAPVAFQHDDAGNKMDVKVAYTVDAKRQQYGFTMGDYDRSRPLTIDPLLGSTYFGGTGTGSDVGTAIAVQPSSGVVYITGYTYSTDLPGTSGGAQPSKGGGQIDAFIARFNSNLTALLGATYFGGAGSDAATAITINPNTGNVYITGTTTSSTLPGTAGSPQPTTGSPASLDSDAFVAVFNGSLDTLIRSSFHGGTGDDQALAMAYHPTSGQIYIGGFSTGANTLPGVTGGAQSTSGVGRPDCFVTRFSADLTQRLQSTYISGSGGILCKIYGLAVHPTSGFIYATGVTDHPALPGIASGNQTTVNPLRSAFVTRLNANLTSITASTYDSVASGGYSEAYAIAIHGGTGDIYIGGYGRVPFTTGSAQPSGGDGFISRFAANLGSRYIATAIGASTAAYTEVRSLVYNAVNGDLYAAGCTAVVTTWPPASSGVQSTYAGGSCDGLIVRINAGLTAFSGATYLGTSARDSIVGIAFNPLTGNIYVVGETEGSGLPGASIGAFPNFAGGQIDAFVSAFTPDLSNFGVTPNPFTFKPRLNVIVNTTHIDGPVQMSGLTAFTNVSIGGAQGSMCISSTAGCSCNLSPGGVYGPTGFIANGQYLCVKNVAAAAASTFSESTIVVGGYTTKFMNYTGQLFACTMDIDGDGIYEATTDGLMLTRALMGFTGTAVTNGLVGHNPPRNTWARIREHLNNNCGMNLAQ